MEGTANTMEIEYARTNPPLMQVQSDWHQVCKEKTGSFWVSYRKNVESQAIHGKVRVVPDRDPLQFDSEEGFKVTIELKTRIIHITSPDGEHTSTIQSNMSSIPQIHQEKNVTAIDISPGGELCVTGSDDGIVRVWQTKDATMRRDLQGHVGDINTVQWFPSGQVVLTGSSDFQLKIWDVIKGVCGATLKGHAGGILGTAIIERGRNVVSASRDGTVRLWDVSTQTAIHVFGAEPFQQASANGIFVAGSPLPAPTHTEDAHPKEVGTEGKLLLVARENATLDGYDIRSRAALFTLRGSSAMNCCILLADGHSVVAGGEDGMIFDWDIRYAADKPRNIFQRSKAAISDITVKRGVEGEGTRVWASTKDGQLFEWDIESQRVLTELSGVDFEPVNAIAVYGDMAFAVAREGIRKYKLFH